MWFSVGYTTNSSVDIGCGSINGSEVCTSWALMVAAAATSNIKTNSNFFFIVVGD